MDMGRRDEGRLEVRSTAKPKAPRATDEPRRLSAQALVVHPYWDLWEHTAGPAFRAERIELVTRAVGAVVKRLRSPVEVVIAGHLDGPASARAILKKSTNPTPGVVLVIQTMAAPPEPILQLLDGLRDPNVVIWALHEQLAVDQRFDHGSITTRGATVGAPMLTAMLTRRRQPYELVLGRLGDARTEGLVARALQSAVAAASLKDARIGQVGPDVPGYLHVDLDRDALRARTGIDIQRIDLREFLARFEEVPNSDCRRLADEVRRDWTFEGPVDPDGFERSMRAALAIDRLVVDHGLDAGAFNCHVEGVRFSDPVGVAPCWALGRSTTQGVPWTCTGDVVTAVAMLVNKRIGAAALYHEIEEIDYATGEVVIANSGEHDLAWMDPSRTPRLRMNGWFCGKDPRCGVCAVIEPPAGPGTLVALAPDPEARGGFRLVAARGELTGRSFSATGTANGAFRFTGGPIEEAWSRWTSLGVNHHSSATPGDISAEVVMVARFLGIDAAIV